MEFIFLRFFIYFDIILLAKDIGYLIIRCGNCSETSLSLFGFLFSTRNQIKSVSLRTTQAFCEPLSTWGMAR